MAPRYPLSWGPLDWPLISMRKHTMNYNKWRSGTVKIKCLEPISTQGMTQDDVVDLAVRCRKLIEAECIELTKSLPRVQ